MTFTSSVNSGPISPVSTASATVTGSDRNSQISAPAKMAAIDGDSRGEADAEARRAHDVYSLGNSGMGSPSPAAANCGITIDESDTMAVASRSG